MKSISFFLARGNSSISRCLTGPHAGADRRGIGDGYSLIRYPYPIEELPFRQVIPVVIITEFVAGLKLKHHQYKRVIEEGRLILSSGVTSHHADERNGCTFGR